jgi:hypothetical protein
MYVFMYVCMYVYEGGTVPQLFSYIISVFHMQIYHVYTAHVCIYIYTSNERDAHTSNMCVCACLAIVWRCRKRERE